MLDIAELRQRLDLAKSRESAFSERPPGDSLVDEYCHRMACARASLEQFEGADPTATNKQSDDTVRSLMFCCYNLNRCDAIFELLAEDNPADSADSSHVPLEAIRLGRDRVFLRWCFSRLSWLRSRILRYEDYYEAPSLSETIKVSLVGRIATRPRLLRLIQSLRR